MIPEESEYKGWRVLVFNERGASYDATAIKPGHRQLYAYGQRGKGSKQRAYNLIKQQIDNQEKIT